MEIGTLLIAIVALPFLGGVVATVIPFRGRNAEAWLSGSVAFLNLCFVIVLYPAMTDGGVVYSRIAWLPSLGLEFTLRMDGFSWMFALIVTGIGFLVTIYSRYYMPSKEKVARFYCYFLAFMGSMLGIVLSGNLIQLVFFWELTTLFSFLLIGYWYQNTNAREGARMALTITGAGGLCLFAGVLLLGHIAGSYDLDRVLAAGDAIRNHRLYIPCLVLILLGALTKSAQFPFHFWLPHAMAAPTPISAYLHSATLVKAGVFLLARLWPVMAGTDAWTWLVGTAGLITFVLGAYVANFQRDLKGLLAYSTISHLGLITLLLGLNTPMAAVAAIFHIMNHATFKASLFMAVGIIDREAGTRDINRLNGLFRYMPKTATLAMVASAAMAGVPLLNGFLSKEMFFAESLKAVAPTAALQGVLPYFATLAGAFAVAYSLRFILDVFFDPPTAMPRTPQEPPHWMRSPIELLVLICLVVGIIPAITIGPFLDIAVRAVLRADTPAYDLALWHGFNLPLLMSAVAMAGGYVLYALFKRYFATIDGPPVLRHVRGRRIFERLLVFLSWRLARSLERLIGTRRLQPQLLILVVVTLAAVSAPLVLRGLAPWRGVPAGFDLSFAALWIVGIVCAVGAAYMAKFHRLAALMMMGGAGVASALTFVWLSAPDLAITQLLVEIVTTVLLLLGLRWLPKRMEEVSAPRTAAARLRRVRDLAIAVLMGGSMAALTYAVLTRPLPDSISAFFLERAYIDGGGTNVVNVILVDFRGFDTLGEIIVLGIVSLAVFALLRRFRPAPDSIERPEQQRLSKKEGAEAEMARRKGVLADSLLVPALIVRVLFPVIGSVAVYLWMRGHDLPGGGFVAGLTMSIAFILQYMAGGTRWVEARLIILPVKWIGTGLLIAGATGAAAGLFGFPFLTTYFSYAQLPGVGAVPVASALAFDLGVFVLVTGSTVLILIALAHQSIRRYRLESLAPEAALVRSEG